MQEDSDSYDLNRMDERLEDFKLKLFDFRREYECTEMEIYAINQLKDKGLFIQKDVERKYEYAADELKEIHGNYIKCIGKVNSQEGIDCQEKINSLTLRRDNLRKELQELKTVMDENNKKLTEIKKIIAAQEKKNIASVRKLKRMMEKMSISQNLKKRVNAVLCDPRITKRDLSDQNI